MIKNYKKLLSSKGYWMNKVFLLYPFFIVSCFSYIAEKKTGVLLILFKAAVFNVVVFSTVLILSSIISSFSIKKNILRFAYFFQFICTFLFVYHFFLYDQLIGLPTVYALIDTNYHEATEFAGANFKLEYLIISLLLSFPMLYCTVKPFSLPIHDSTSKWFFSIMPLLIFGTMMVYLQIVNGRSYWIYNPILAIPGYASAAIEEKQKISLLYASMPSLSDKVKVRDDGDKMTHVLILSESINRGHMSLYGYPRATTPKLSSMANNLFIQKNACSSRTSTIPALKEILTFANREDASNLFNAPNIIQIMHAAGFETYWLSNQQEVGTYDSFVSIFAKSSDHKLFVDHRGWGEGISLDEKLFPPLEKILANGIKKKFIIIHLIGAHTEYYARYSQEYDIFNSEIDSHISPKNVVSSPSAIKRYNEYDNAILYNDYIASHIIAMQNSQEPVTVTYISDHGEAVAEKGDFFGHADLPYRSVSEVPLFFWFSEPSKKYIADKIEPLSHNLTTSFQSDQLIHSLLDLYGAEYPLVDYKNSLFGTNFKSKNRYCDSL